MKRRITILLSAAAVALVLASAAWAIRFTDESYLTPAGSVGAPYSFTFAGAGGCGPALPYQFTIIGGKLPPGLSLAMNGHVTTTVDSRTIADVRVDDLQTQLCEALPYTGSIQVMDPHDNISVSRPTSWSFWSSHTSTSQWRSGSFAQGP